MDCYVKLPKKTKIQRVGKQILCSFLILTVTIDVTTEHVRGKRKDLRLTQTEMKIIKRRRELDVTVQCINEEQIATNLIRRIWSSLTFGPIPVRNISSVYIQMPGKFEIFLSARSFRSVGNEMIHIWFVSHYSTDCVKKSLARTLYK